MSDILTTCDEIREIAYAIHRYFGHGYLEKVYESALVNRLLKAGISVEQQVPITVRDEDGTIVGEYVADLVVNNELIIELKAGEAICEAHTAQVLGYLRATGLKHALLINFGGPNFQIKKYVL
ncbi:MAG: GxxExxY protein [Pontiellaceae bacterium]|nr:GxxExxY protein [Pontiellaceae bacterium]MBN2786107.1 GxxExxY protein [Pontiellaceae bacterium]